MVESSAFVMTSLQEKLLKEKGSPEELFAKFDVFQKKYCSYIIERISVWAEDTMCVVQELKKRGYKIALASSTGPKLIARIMEDTGMRPWFDLIVSGGQFKQSKPDPEIYHYTAKTLKVKEEECFVIEDSEVGIQAGKAAGMTVAALRDDRFGFDQGKADHHMDSLMEILDYLP